MILAGVSDASESPQPVSPPSPLSDAPLPSASEVRARLTQRTEEIEQANAKRKAFLGLVRGSKLRVGVVEAEAEGFGLEAMLGKLGITAATLMLAEIVNGNLPVKDAKMAADVAKLGMEVHRAMTGTDAEDVKEMSPDQRERRRQALVAGAQTLAKDLAQRAKDAEAAAAGNPSPTGPASLAIVRPSPPVPAQEA